MQFSLYVKIFYIKQYDSIIRTMSKDMIDALQDDWSEQRPDLELEPMGIVLRIQALAKILGDQAAVRLQEFDLQWWQYDALSALRRQGAPYEMAATDLADDNMLTSGAMTNRIDRLEEAGLVRRKPDDADRRKVLVQLTEKGLRLIEGATEARFEAATEALEDLTTKQRKSLQDLLRAVLTSQP